MKHRTGHNGFSLTEALIATAILAIGLAMIAMAFPVGVKLASIATERPVGVVAANEVFAKIQLYSAANPNATSPRTALDYSLLPLNACVDLPTLQRDIMPNCYLETLEPGYAGSLASIDNTFERFYPSLIPQPAEKRYFWSPLLRRYDPNTSEIQTTVFVCRMLGMGVRYYDMDVSPVPNNDNLWPVPVKVWVQGTGTGNVIQVLNNTQFQPTGAAYSFFTEGCLIVENSLGGIYRVLEMQNDDAAAGKETLVLDKNFQTLDGTPSVWVIPPAIGSSRNPCIDVVQKVMTF